MDRLLAVFFAAVVASCSAPRATDPNALALTSGSDLYSVCTHEGERAESAVVMDWACLSYIASAVDSYSAVFCPAPANSTRGQARDIVMKYLRDHPQSRNGSTIGVVWLALSEAWPCQFDKPA
jgi:hypothetical protein